MSKCLRSGVRNIICAAVGCYAAYVALTYWRYGAKTHRHEANPLLDSLLPEYEVREIQHVSVQAPSDVTMAAAREISFHDSWLARLIFALRDLPSRLRCNPVAPLQSRPLLEETGALGWRQIGEEPGSQIIMAAVTRPWKQKVKFVGLLSDEFTGFHEPDYAKIAWTLEVEPRGDSASVFRTETRVATTDSLSREKFRRYWAALSPGIIIIRYEMLRLVKQRAERRVEQLKAHV